MKTTRYVLGFAFDSQYEFVLMVEKLHGPEINLRKLNGVGGKLEEGESAEYAMVREFNEETGLRAQWIQIGRMFGNGWELDIFRGIIEDETGRHKNVNDVGEQLQWEETASVMNPLFSSWYAQNVPTMITHAIVGCGQLSIKVDN
jgi:8-oxo-dGTP pyrophosphatase MutT (NUDIX family)